MALGDERVLPDGLVLRSPSLKVTLHPFGARLTSVLLPDRAGEWGEATLGHVDDRRWLDDVDYLGATVGRVANRIRDGRFVLDRVEHQVATGPDGHTLHGGPESFDRRSWGVARYDTRPNGGDVEFALVSEDGDNGFPGRLDVRATYSLDDARLSITYEATSDRTTPVNLTNHTYWNLAGRGTVEQHMLSVQARQYLPVDNDLLPTGELASVESTPFDYREPTPVGLHLRADDPQLVHARGVDHTLVLDAPSDGQPLRPAARLHDPDSGRSLTISTDQPGLQVYTGNFLDGSLRLRAGLARQGDGICLETQHFPDSVNQPAFPSTLLRPGAQYLSRTVLHFTTAR